MLVAQINAINIIKTTKMKKTFTLVTLAFLVMLSFKSQAQCNAPVNLTAVYSNNVTTFSWAPVGTATDYIFEIDWAGGDWSWGGATAVDTSFSLTGLMQGGNFQWRVMTNCGGTYSAYSTTAFYNSPCNIPYNLSTTNIGTNSAVLNWQQSSTNNNNNTGFSVSYRLANTNNAWIQLTNTTNNPTATFLNLTGLAAGTAYEWRVRRACSACNSLYETSQFVTLSCISNGNNSSEWIDFFRLGSINRTSGAEPGGYANIATSTNLTIGAANSTGQISAGFSGAVKKQKYSVYIDFNRNGSFNDPGERLINGDVLSNASIYNFSITVPGTATAGPTRMRVIMSRNPSTITPCMTGYNGETEDYAVNLVVPSFNLIQGNQAESAAEKKTETVSKAADFIKMVTTSNVTVSPNPSTGMYKITVPATEQAFRYDIVNQAGFIVKTVNVTSNIIQADITNAPAGIYFVKIYYKSGKTAEQKIQKM
jgi:hypothetical protein